MKTSLEFLTFACLLGLSVEVFAGSHSAASNITTVDTRDNVIAVSGRVLAVADRGPISGATVTLAGQHATTSAAGLFSFPGVSLSGGNTIEVSKSGFATYSGTVAVPAGATAVTVPDVLLVEDDVSRPVITKLDPRLKGLFLSGAPLNNEFTASVDWNGNSPGFVRFSVNGMPATDETGVGPEYVASLNMGGAAFHPSFDIAGNQVTVQAVGSGGQSSDTVAVRVGVLPLPNPLQVLTGQGWPFTTYSDGHVALDCDFPNPPIKTVVTFPVIGRFGFEVAANASFDYTVTDGDWEVAFGIGAEGKQGKRGRRPTIPGLTRYPRMKLYLGNKEIFGKIEAGARGTATIQSGITFDEVFGHGEIEAKLELGRVGLLDIVPGLGTAAAWVPGLSDITKGISVIIYAIPGIDGEITFATHPEFRFDTLELAGKVGLDAAYEPRMSDDFELRV